MTVDPLTTHHRAERDGTTHYFCSAGCRERFLRDVSPARPGRVAGPGGG